MIPDCERGVLDRCINAIIAGQKEVDVDGYGIVSRLRQLDPAEVDAYAAERLPRAMWGLSVRLVWTRVGVESASASFLEQHVLGDREREVVEQVRVLWPHLGMAERWEWVNRIKAWFGGDWVATVQQLAPAEPATVRFLMDR